MKQEIKPGVSGEVSTRVLPQHTITLGNNPSATVLATPHLIYLMEHAARKAILPFLDAGEESVGVTVNIEHQAATPLNAMVRAIATVKNVAGKLIDFDLVAFDQKDQIGAGSHRRAIITLDKFTERLAQKGPPAVENGVAMKSSLPNTRLVTVSIEDQIAMVTLNRPEQLNAINRAMALELEQLVDWFGLHPEAVRVILIAGAGNAFCAGDDIKEIGGLSQEEAAAFNLQEIELLDRLKQIPQPLIAAIHGPCFGAGVMLAAFCDFRLAAVNAKFGLPEIKLGWPPSFGVAQIVHQIGIANATDLCLTGRTFTAQQAKELGMVNEIVAPSMLMSKARALAKLLLAQSPIALRETKLLLRQLAWHPPSLHTLDHEAYLRCLKTDDAKEGAAAFREHRPTKFKGR
jgi:enoyl-CoA hydratase